ncbi:MAG: exodeoxyribonuclease VII small subunit [Rhodospirillales bacterium]|nr:exodeoxyribonuclease VII small subunit [Rhodospirillales bacterium]
MAEPPIPTDIAKLSFEDALKELEQIVQTLEGGRGKLDEAIKSYERGAALKRHCEKKLAEAQAKIEKISFGADGGVKSEPASLG